MSKRQHVFPQGERWAVRSGGAERATRVFDSRGEALGFARDLARRAGTELFVHGKDGMVREHADFSARPAKS